MNDPALAPFGFALLGVLCAVALVHILRTGKARDDYGPMNIWDNPLRFNMRVAALGAIVLYTIYKVGRF